MRSLFCSVLLVAVSFLIPTALAGEKEFFQNIKGNWSGPGEIVAGKYKGTKFVCNFAGNTPSAAPGMSINGACRVGVFPQDMNAEIVLSGGKFSGKFLDGEGGKGMDIMGGRYTKGRLVVDIRRNELKGIMVANLNDPNRLRITVSVNHGDKLVPVIGMNLARRPGSIVTGSVD